MSKVMRQIPFDQLMIWALTELKNESSIFNVNRFYISEKSDSPRVFDSKLELPFGPAAGPHTQLAQNIISAYLAGSRFFELKTVQMLDGEDLPVSKPCIYAPDEAYNVEWSTELRVPQAMDEYIKAWFAIKLLCAELKLGDPDGFIFNMSVGYDLEGVKSPKINSFIDGLKCAEETDTWKRCMDWALANTSRFKNINENYIVNISSYISNSITLSTLHGCPPEEIERIATYLMKEKKLNTFIKCNPTLLGYKFARDTLNGLGYDYLVFDDHHFNFDLQYTDAVPMLRGLMKTAKDNSLEFGVKLTNTFPVKITRNELPGEEMYMSGRSLFPLSIELAARLSETFDGDLKISFSGGADFHNILDIYNCGIWPITLCTTILKPGGYKRLYQLAEKLSDTNASALLNVDVKRLKEFAEAARNSDYYRKPITQPIDRKLKSHIPVSDCSIAPCKSGCPLNQDVPAYLRLAGEGKYEEALTVITERNPLPFITGTICSHKCMDKCSRSFYEGSVDIRGVKLQAAESAFDVIKNSKQKTALIGKKIAIIGGGPAGLAAAYFLSKAGYSVTIFEKSSCLGGTVSHIIPEFRIDSKHIANDIEFATTFGVDLRLNTEVSCTEQLRSEGFEKIIVAVGATKAGVLNLGSGVTINAIEFLKNYKAGPENVVLGKNVIVVGGGNTAMDTARAAARVSGVESVTVVYRRTKHQMPASAEELSLALSDGIILKELLAPSSFSNGTLICTQMELGAADHSGRRSPVSTGTKVEVPADVVLSAIGENVDDNLLDNLGIKMDERRRPIYSEETLQTSESDVYIIGDALRGPATIAEAIADAIKCSKSITGLKPDTYEHLNVSSDIEQAMKRKGVLFEHGKCENECDRCLECATVCENCVDVCPNRANVSVTVNGRRQVLHIDYMCNECGNCEIFCPYTGAPYKDKFTLFANEDDFSSSSNSGFLPLPDGSVRIRLENVVIHNNFGKWRLDDIGELIQATIDKKYLLFKH